MKIGILNCGGDCPGLNAVNHGVVGAASTLGWEVFGFRDGEICEWHEFHNPDVPAEAFRPD